MKVKLPKVVGRPHLHLLQAEWARDHHAYSLSFAQKITAPMPVLGTCSLRRMFVRCTASVFSEQLRATDISLVSLPTAYISATSRSFGVSSPTRRSASSGSSSNTSVRTSFWNTSTSRHCDHQKDLSMQVRVVLGPPCQASF